MTTYSLQNLVDFEDISCSGATSSSCYKHISFNSAGAHMYIAREDIDGSDVKSVSFLDFTLSTPWDVSTAVQSHQKVLSGLTMCRGFHIKPDGTHLFIIEATKNVSQVIHDFPFGTPWDITTISTHTSRTLSTSFWAGGTHSPELGTLIFSEDGSEFFTSWHYAVHMIQGITLATPWDISSTMSLGASLGNALVSNPSIYGAPSELEVDLIFAFSDSRDKLFLNSWSTDVVRYDLETPGDITSSGWPDISGAVDYNGVIMAVNGMYYATNVNKVYMVGVNGPFVSIAEYSTDFPAPSQYFWTNFSGQSESLV